MKKCFYLLFALAVLSNGMSAQPYKPSWQVFHANEILTVFSTDGTMGQDRSDIGFYHVPFENLNSPSTISIGDLWLGTIDQGQLRLAAQTYGHFSNSYDFYPGPLRPADGKPFTPDDLTNFNRFWSVAGYEIQKHIEDWSDNAYIDHPQISIVGWPGHGNPYFREVNGFDLPDTPQGAAPFHDRNGDGIYNAFDGDYPLPDAVAPGVIPWQIIWMVYNDAAGPHLHTQGQPLGVEVQLTAWAFPSADEPLLNKALFVSKKIINRSGRDYTDFYAGVHTNISIGCPLDDYIGCIPELNAYYGYNATETDKEFCVISGNTQPSYEEKPPVQAVTLLNQLLTGFNMHYNIALSLPTHDITKTQPVSAIEYFNYLTGKWRDGTPLTSGGNGYAPGSVNPAVSFAFPDNPNDPGGWSQVSANLPPSYVYGLGVVRFDSFKNGEIKTLDVVYSTPGLQFEPC